MKSKFLTLIGIMLISFCSMASNTDTSLTEDVSEQITVDIGNTLDTPLMAEYLNLDMPLIIDSGLVGTIKTSTSLYVANLTNDIFDYSNLFKATDNRLNILEKKIIKHNWQEVFVYSDRLNYNYNLFSC